MATVLDSILTQSSTTPLNNKGFTTFDCDPRQCVSMRRYNLSVFLAVIAYVCGETGRNDVERRSEVAEKTMAPLTSLHLIFLVFLCLHTIFLVKLRLKTS